jgi:hypothetical protein
MLASKHFRLPALFPVLATISTFGFKTVLEKVSFSTIDFTDPEKVADEYNKSLCNSLPICDK